MKKIFYYYVVLFGFSSIAFIMPSSGSRKICQTNMNLFQGIFQSSKVDKKEKITQLKKDILSSTKDTDNGLRMSEFQKKKVIDTATELGKLNSAKQIAFDPKMNGVWRLLFTTNNGSSAGKLGPFVGTVDQIVDLDSKVYLNTVKFLNGLILGKLEASWDVIDSNTWEVKFSFISFSFGGIELFSKSLGGIVGTWQMKYLDDDMRILYAMGGRNVEAANIYIMSRVG